jgi:riboflavin kinase/FMN adenylyltransferase
MKVIGTSFDEEIAYLAGEKIVLAIGVFDGVHAGHRFLLKRAMELAGELGAVATVYTFWPYPTRFHASNRKKMIVSRGRKFEILATLGIQCVVEQCFDEDFARILAEDFTNFLKKKFKSLVGICVGPDFKFGHERRGDVHSLRESCGANGIILCVADEFSLDGDRVSSSKIRALLGSQNFSAANRLLGGDATSPMQTKPKGMGIRKKC